MEKVGKSGKDYKRTTIDNYERIYILITGSAGFIGFHLASKLASKNCNVINIDNLNNYYDVGYKKERLKKLKDNF